MQDNAAYQLHVVGNHIPCRRVPHDFIGVSLESSAGIFYYRKCFGQDFFEQGLCLAFIRFFKLVEIVVDAFDLVQDNVRVFKFAPQFVSLLLDTAQLLLQFVSEGRAFFSKFVVSERLKRRVYLVDTFNEWLDFLYVLIVLGSKYFFKNFKHPVQSVCGYLPVI